jgi:hypothetical protein
MTDRPDFRAIKARVSIVDVLKRYGTELRATNQYELRGKCPLPTHSSESAEQSFVVNPGKNVWSCHSASCVADRNVTKGDGHQKKGGDLIELVAFMEKCHLREAGERLEQWFGKQTDAIPPPSAPSRKAPASSPDGSEVVNKPLTFALRDINFAHPYLASRGFDPEECEYLGVGFFPGKGVMRNRIVFPIHDATGQLVAYAGRRVEYSLMDEDPAHIAPENPDLERWKFPAGFRRGQVLYNLHRVTEDDWTEVIVVESFWGALACVRAGIMNSVAIMSNYATDTQVTQLCGFRKVTVFLDGDKPGREGSENLVSRLVNAGIESVERKMLAENMQPDGLKIDTLRVCLGIPPEPGGPLTVTDEALSLLEAAPA